MIEQYGPHREGRLHRRGGGRRTIALGLGRSETAEVRGGRKYAGSSSEAESDSHWAAGEGVRQMSFVKQGARAEAGGWSGTNNLRRRVRTMS